MSTYILLHWKGIQLVVNSVPSCSYLRTYVLIASEYVRLDQRHLLVRLDAYSHAILASTLDLTIMTFLFAQHKTTYRLDISKYIGISKKRFSEQVEGGTYFLSTSKHNQGQHGYYPIRVGDSYLPTLYVVRHD